MRVGTHNPGGNLLTTITGELPKLDPNTLKRVMSDLLSTGPADAQRIVLSMLNWGVPSGQLSVFPEGTKAAVAELASSDHPDTRARALAVLEAWAGESTDLATLAALVEEANSASMRSARAAGFSLTDQIRFLPLHGDLRPFAVLTRTIVR